MNCRVGKLGDSLCPARAGVWVSTSRPYGDRYSTGRTGVAVSVLPVFPGGGPPGMAARTCKRSRVRIGFVDEKRARQREESPESRPSSIPASD